MSGEDDDTPADRDPGRGLMSTGDDAHSRDDNEGLHPSFGYDTPPGLRSSDQNSDNCKLLTAQVSSVNPCYCFEARRNPVKSPPPHGPLLPRPPSCRPKA